MYATFVIFVLPFRVINNNNNNINNNKVTNEEVLRRVNDRRQANAELYLAKETSMDWPCFETRHEITEGRMTDKPTRGRRRIQITEMTNDGDICCSQTGS